MTEEQKQNIKERLSKVVDSLPSRVGETPKEVLVEFLMEQLDLIFKDK